MTEQDLLTQAWSLEYEKKGIPSSFRKDPSKPVIEFITSLKNYKHLGHIAADLGSGQGRNSFYLASECFEVTSIDLIPENAALINRWAQTQNLKIEAFSQSVTDPWPIQENSLDVAIDVFCYKHILTKEKQRRYRKELWKALKPEGIYFISLASEQDGFYGPLLETSPNREEKAIIDPFSGIASFLYSTQSLKEEFSDLFEIIEMKEQTSESPMHGTLYARRMINATFKKRHLFL